jgi:hypothetical protein
MLCWCSPLWCGGLWVLALTLRVGVLELGVGLPWLNTGGSLSLRDVPHRGPRLLWRAAQRRYQSRDVKIFEFELFIWLGSIAAFLVWDFVCMDCFMQWCLSFTPRE